MKVTMGEHCVVEYVSVLRHLETHQELITTKNWVK